MNTVNIKLNFFPLKEQEISFNVFRQEYSGQIKMDSFYRSKLPKEILSSNYQDYWVCFSNLQGFEKFNCIENYNPQLTIHFLWETLIKKVKTNFIENTYFVADKAFSKQVYLTIAEHDEGKETIVIEPYYLKKSKKFGFLVDFQFKVNKGVPFSKKIQQLSLSLDRNFYSNKGYYSDKYDKILYFISKYKGKIFPLLIDDKEYDIEDTLFTLEPQLLKQKKYIFKDNQESNSQFNGLKSYKPFRDIKSEVLLAFIFQESQRNNANDVYSAITGQAYPATFAGMQKVFDLKVTKENVTKIIINDYDKKSLLNVEIELKKIIAQNSGKKVIGVFIEHSKDNYETFSISPYYFLKYIFIKNQTPLQAITIEHIKGKDGLKWSASGIGLQLFSKLGGIPWKVRPSNEKCIIFGLGSAHKKDTEGKINKYFAYSVCLDSSGLYKKLNILGQETSKDKYLEQLKENIYNTIYENIDQEIEKCIIHMPFKIRKDEILKIKESVNNLSEKCKNIDFKFIKINTSNKFFGFAENNSKVPYESSFVVLSSNEYLMWFEGLQYDKENVSKRISNPVHIEFLYDDKPSFEERKKYLQDIINLSGANWRGFNAKSSPISIYYPEIIANYISEFRKIDEEETIDISDINIPWFL